MRAIPLRGVSSFFCDPLDRRERCGVSSGLVFGYEDAICRPIPYRTRYVTVTPALEWRPTLLPRFLRENVGKVIRALHNIFCHFSRSRGIAFYGFCFVRCSICVFVASVCGGAVDVLRTFLVNCIAERRVVLRGVIILISCRWLCFAGEVRPVLCRFRGSYGTRKNADGFATRFRRHAVGIVFDSYGNIVSGKMYPLCSCSVFVCRLLPIGIAIHGSASARPSFTKKERIATTWDVGIGLDVSSRVDNVPRSPVASGSCVIRYLSCVIRLPSGFVVVFYVREFWRSTCLRRSWLLIFLGIVARCRRG